MTVELRPAPPVPEPAVRGGPLSAALGLFRRQPLLRHVAFGLVGAVVLWGVTTSVSDYNDFQLAQIGAYVVGIAGLSLLTGLNGQISLGHGAFMMVGAYTTALAMKHQHWPLAIVIILSAVTAAVAGAVVGVGAARLRGPYLAGATLALAVALPQLPSRYSGALGGEPGIPVNTPTPPSFLGSGVTPYRYLAWVVAICVIVTFILLANLIASRFGRDFRTVRDDEIAASLAGIHVSTTQVVAFVVSAACAGLGGSLLALATAIVNPAGFSLTVSIALLTGAVLGGLGTLAGAVWGGILVVYFPQWANSLSNHLGLDQAIKSNLALGFYGLILIVAMLVFPGGIQEAVRRLYRLVRRTLPFGRPAPPDPGPTAPAGATAGVG